MKTSSKATAMATDKDQLKELKMANISQSFLLMKEKFRIDSKTVYEVLSFQFLVTDSYLRMYIIPKREQFRNYKLEEFQKLQFLRYLQEAETLDLRLFTIQNQDDHVTESEIQQTNS